MCCFVACGLLNTSRSSLLSTPLVNLATTRPWLVVRSFDFRLAGERLRKQRTAAPHCEGRQWPACGTREQVRTTLAFVKSVIGRQDTTAGVAPRSIQQCHDITVDIGPKSIRPDFLHCSRCEVSIQSNWALVLHGVLLSPQCILLVCTEESQMYSCVT